RFSKLAAEILANFIRERRIRRTAKNFQFITHSRSSKSDWGGRIRTFEYRFQRPVPYHLATPQLEIATPLRFSGNTPNGAMASSASRGNSRPKPTRHEPHRKAFGIDRRLSNRFQRVRPDKHQDLTTAL